REVAGDEADHWLRRAFEMRVHRRSFRTVRHGLERLRVANFGVDDVLPEVHALAGAAFAVRHPGRHFRRRSHVDARAAEGLLDLALRRWNSRAGLAGEKQHAESQRARIDAFSLRGLR